MRYWIPLLIFAFALNLLFNVYWVTAIGLSMATIEAIFFFRNIEKKFIFYRYVLLMSLLQWIVAPWIDYKFFNSDRLYSMYVPEATYMNIVVPSLIFFKLGLSAFEDYSNKRFELWTEISSDYFRQFTTVGVYFIIIGVASTLLQSSISGGLAFVFYLLGNLKFVGGLILLFANHRYAVILNVFLILMLFAESLGGGMFHELLLWTILLVPFFLLKFQISSSKKIFLLGTVFSFVFIIQAVKGQYREIVWKGQEKELSHLEIFSNLIFNDNSNHKWLSQGNLHNTNIRFNQGWIISRILYYVPEYEEFAKGETFEEAIISGIVPRFLFPEKRGAGGQELFERFTGLQLHGSTSMGTSIVGEAYANFGIYGTYLFMLLWGFLLSYIIYYHLNLSFKFPILFFFLPWILIGVIKAETDFVTVFNFLSKSYILLTIIFLLLRKSGIQLEK